MKKTYADECLERAEKATEGPWNLYATKFILTKADPSREHSGDAQFIAHARTDVPELARRLKEACRYIRDEGYIDLAEELEAPLEENKK